jgi:hypothetical protein
MIYLEKLRCLNLSSLPGSFKESVFNQNEEITIDNSLIEEFFMIKNEKKIVAKVSDSMRENEAPSISNVLDKNKYTSICIYC